MRLGAAAVPLIRTAVPIMTSSMLSFLMTTVDLLFVGHLGPKELAAAACGNLFFNVLQHPIMGLATAMDTLLSQAFGARKLIAYGVNAQTGLLVLMLITLPFMQLLYVAEPLLLAARMDVELAKSAGRFCRLLIPGVVPFFAFTALSKFLQAQDILNPAVVIAAVANVANLLLNYLLIYRIGLGFDGAPLATSICRWLQLVLICAYLFARRHTLAPSLPPLRVEWRALPTRCRQFLQLGLPGAAMLAFEAWFFEVATYLASFLGTASLDAHVVMLNICSFTFLSVPFALGIAASIRVRQSLGAGRAEEASATARATIVLVVVVMSSLAVLKVAFRSVLGYLFTTDPEVVARVAALAPIAAVFQLSDGTQAAIAGVMRGQGRQALVAGLNLAGFWVIGLGVGVFLTFGPPRLGVRGLWWGLVVGLTATSLLGTFMLWRTDWTAQAAAAVERSGAKDRETSCGQGDGHSNGVGGEKNACGRSSGSAAGAARTSSSCDGAQVSATPTTVTAAGHGIEHSIELATAEEHNAPDASETGGEDDRVRPTHALP